MKKLLLTALCVLCLGILCAAADNDAKNSLKASLHGLNETPPVSTQSTGSFMGTISADGSSITYTLTYTNLSTQVLFSHIHFGFPKEVGNVMVFLCGPAAGAPGGPPVGFPSPPPCPDTTSGTVTGTITTANVVGPLTQGITPKVDFAKVIQVIREGASYVNVHSSQSPAGEIRGLVHATDGDRDDR